MYSFYHKYRNVIIFIHKFTIINNKIIYFAGTIVYDSLTNKKKQNDNIPATCTQIVIKRVNSKPCSDP